MYVQDILPLPTARQVVPILTLSIAVSFCDSVLKQKEAESTIIFYSKWQQQPDVNDNNMASGVYVKILIFATTVDIFNTKHFTILAFSSDRVVSSC